MSKLTENGFTVEIHLSRREVKQIADDLANRVWFEYSDDVLKSAGYTSYRQIADLIVNDSGFHDSLENTIRGLKEDQEDAIIDSLTYTNVPVIMDTIEDRLNDIRDESRKAEELIRARQLLEQAGFQVTK
jgi:hypothetical protein